MQVDPSLSNELKAVKIELDSVLDVLNQKKYGDYPKDVEAARKEFFELFERISKCHESLVNKIIADSSDNFVPTGSIFKLGLKNYAHGIDSLIGLCHVIEEKSKK